MNTKIINMDMEMSPARKYFKVHVIVIFFVSKPHNILGRKDVLSPDLDF